MRHTALYTHPEQMKKHGDVPAKDELDEGAPPSMSRAPGGEEEGRDEYEGEDNLMNDLLHDSGRPFVFYLSLFAPVCFFPFLLRFVFPQERDILEISAWMESWNTTPPRPYSQTTLLPRARATIY